MDRTAWVAVTLCAVGLVGWNIYLAKQTPPRKAPVVSAQATPFSSSTSGLPDTVPSASPTPPAAESGPRFQEVTETLRNSDFELHLTNRAGGIAEVVLLNHIAAQGDKRVVLNSPEHPPIGAILEDPAKPLLPEFKMTRQGDAVQFERELPEKVTIRKKFSLPQTSEKKDNFLVELDVDLSNGGTKPYENAGYYLALGTASATHPKDYPSYTRLAWCVGGSAKGTDVGWFAGGSGLLGLGARAPQSYYQQDVKGAEWAAVSNQFFTTLIAPLTGKAESVWARRFDVDPALKVFGIEGAARMAGFKLEPGQTYSSRFQIYSGPKIYHRLARLDHNEAEILDLGVFKIVSQFLLNFLNLLHDWVHDYGIAILLLTTVIKLVLWPLQTKANRSMRQTGLLAPKVQELREKYKDDPTKMNQEVMKMYKEYGINPVGGCLPMVIQIPIFFGLFKMLGQAVELRNAKFLWVKDLSQPDTVAHLPILGWPVNIIPLCMAATQIWLMQMTPKTGDATQRRVMMFMPLIFLFICYNFAAALALYYTAQNILSIVQFYQNKNQPLPTLAKVAPAGKRKR
jgi:YidC/Oxa1 family membrane protein insertase